MNSCVFCQIIHGELPAHIIRETEETISFLSRENHPLVVSKKHIPNIYELDNETGHKLIEEITTIAKATKEGLKTDGVYLTQANDPAAGQDVFHLHFHLYPRWEDKDMSERTMAKDELLLSIKSKL